MTATENRVRRTRASDVWCARRTYLNDAGVEGLPPVADERRDMTLEQGNVHETLMREFMWRRGAALVPKVDQPVDLCYVSFDATREMTGHIDDLMVWAGTTGLVEYKSIKSPATFRRAASAARNGTAGAGTSLARYTDQMRRYVALLAASDYEGFDEESPLDLEVGSLVLHNAEGPTMTEPIPVRLFPEGTTREDVLLWLESELVRVLPDAEPGIPDHLNIHSPICQGCAYRAYCYGYDPASPMESDGEVADPAHLPAAERWHYAQEMKRFVKEEESALRSYFEDELTRTGGRAMPIGLGYVVSRKKGAVRSVVDRDRLKADGLEETYVTRVEGAPSVQVRRKKELSEESSNG